MRATFCVVTPNYNMGAYLAETIESVLANLRPGDEYFIVDGGSTDDSVNIIRKYEHHLTGWICEKDQGYADAIAKGFARSTVEYQCWINCGDLLLVGSLDNAAARLASTGADMIFGDDFYIDSSGRVISRSCGKMHSLRNMMLFGGWTPLQDACFWKRELYEVIGGLDIRLKYAADYDLFLRMSMTGRCEYIPLVFSAFRKHEGQKSIQGCVPYKHERNLCQVAALKRNSYPFLISQLLVMAYWFQVRVRSRVLQRFYNSKRQEGKAVLDLVCGAYE